MGVRADLTVQAACSPEGSLQCKQLQLVDTALTSKPVGLLKLLIHLSNEKCVLGEKAG